MENEKRTKKIVVKQMIDLLLAVKIDDQEAELNAISISDNNGGRIYL